MTAGSRSEPTPLALTRTQIDTIARQEGADDATVREALRRMSANPSLRHGEVRSPGAFFRGIVRAVIEDRAAESHVRRLDPCRRAPPPTPSASIGPAEAPVEPDRTAGRMALRARQLLSAGAAEGAVRDQLHLEFPLASSDLVAWALTNGRALYRALAR